MAENVNVTVWNEFRHEKSHPEVAEIYPDGIHNTIAAALREAGFDVPSPCGAMYLWVPLPEGTLSEPFARRLLLEQGVALLPGKSLGDGGEGFLRIALTCSEDRLRQAAARMARMLEASPVGV